MSTSINITANKKAPISFEIEAYKIHNNFKLQAQRLHTFVRPSVSEK